MTHVIIVAAGKGSRFGSDLPKQFCLLGERPVLMHTVIRIGRALPHANIVIVLHSDFVQFWERMCEQFGFVSPRVVVGGATRWESVKNALDSIAPDPDDIVMIHDGVRPVVSSEMVHRIQDTMLAADAAIPVVPVTDSLRHINPDGTSECIDRSTLVGVQTPQAFKGELITKAYQLPYNPLYTDDASVYEAAGFGAPKLVEGSPSNIKVTHPRDIEVAALFLGIR